MKNNILNKFITVKEEKRQINKLISSWKDLMIETCTWSMKYETLTLKDIKKENYGYSANLIFPNGLRIMGFSALKQLDYLFDNKIGYKFSYIDERENPTVKCKFEVLSVIENREV